MKGTEDLRTINKVLKGNINDFEILVKKYSKRIYGYIFKSVRDKYTTEELTQEVFLKAYRSLDKFDLKKSFSVWLFTIARNTTIDYFKKTCHQYTNVLNEEVDYNRLNNTSLNPMNIVEEKEKLKEIDRIINALPHKYRELIVLKYFEELNYREISKRLNIPINKVKWRLYEARKQMNKAFEDSERKERRVRKYGM